MLPIVWAGPALIRSNTAEYGPIDFVWRKALSYPPTGKRLLPDNHDWTIAMSNTLGNTLHVRIPTRSDNESTLCWTV